MITTRKAEIDQISRSVFSTMLNMEITRIDDGPLSTHATLVATIQITGAWVGTVVLSLCPEAARAAAAAMLQIADPTTEDEEDVAAELVNMIGGNLKALLPAQASLSLPNVVVGRELGVRTHAARLLDDVWFGSESGYVRVRLFQQI